MARMGEPPPSPAAVGAILVSVLNSVRVTTSVLLSTKVVLKSRPRRVRVKIFDLMLVTVVAVVLVWVMYWVAGTAGFC